jgi:hypothetical protein
MQQRIIPKTDDAECFYGNGKVFVLLGEDCRQFAECNFAMHPIENEGNAVDFSVSCEIAVCCGTDATRKSTVQALRALIDKIEGGECDPRS